MFKIPKRPMSGADVQPTWEYLVKQERLLCRNLMLARIIQPVGLILCAWNFLLVGMNLLLFVAGDAVASSFSRLPFLPPLVESLPRNGWMPVVFTALFLGYLIPFAVCALITVVYGLVHCKKGEEPIPPLAGTQKQCAALLAQKAENIYDLRRKMPQCPIQAVAGILTMITAFPIVAMFVGYAREGAMSLQLALIALLLLFVLLAYYGLYVFAMYTVFYLNTLLYRTAGQWKLYRICIWIGDYLDAPDYNEASADGVF